MKLGTTLTLAGWFAPEPYRSLVVKYGPLLQEEAPAITRVVGKFLALMQAHDLKGVPPAQAAAIIEQHLTQVAVPGWTTQETQRWIDRQSSG